MKAKFAHRYTKEQNLIEPDYWTMNYLDESLEQLKIFAEL